jgi:hypothetical protein
MLQILPCLCLTFSYECSSNSRTIVRYQLQASFVTYVRLRLVEFCYSFHSYDFVWLLLADCIILF